MIAAFLQLPGVLCRGVRVLSLYFAVKKCIQVKSVITPSSPSLYRLLPTHRALLLVTVTATPPEGPPGTYLSGSQLRLREVKQCSQPRGW